MSSTCSVKAFPVMTSFSSACVLGDDDGFRQAALQHYGIESVTSISIRQLSISARLKLLMPQFRAQCPQLLWIRLPGSSFRNGDKSATVLQSIDTILTEQLFQGRLVFIEAHRDNQSWNSGTIAHAIRNGSIKLHKISWCLLGIKHSDGTNPTNETCLLYTSPSPRD